MLKAERPVALPTSSRDHAAVLTFRSAWGYAEDDLTAAVFGAMRYLQLPIL